MGEEVLEVGQRVVGLGDSGQLPAELAEALEEDLAHQAGLVAEELVDGGDRGRAGCRHSPGREAGDPVGCERGHGNGDEPLPQRRCSLLDRWHRAEPIRNTVPLPT
jgi:hypothetical protein